MSKTLCFTIDAWSAWSSSRCRQSDWVNWGMEKQISANQLPLDVSGIPAMKRRRMSRLSQMAIATALNCTNERLDCMNGSLSESGKHTSEFDKAVSDKPVPDKPVSDKPLCVFASKHGELSRTVKILQTMAAQQDMSPASFSLSVHNTSLGLFSIIDGNEQPATTVTAGEDTFGYGLLESSVILSRFPKSQVLYVYHDEPVPDTYSQYDESIDESICIALLLSATTLDKKSSKDAIQFSFNARNLSDSEECQTDSIELGSAFLKYFLSDRKNATAHTPTTSWHWGQ